MDGDRFDHLLSSLARTPSRRALLRLLAGVVLGRRLASLLGRPAAAAKRKRRKNKKRRRRDADRPACAGRADGAPCAAGGASQCCNEICVDTATDEAHCGGCNASPCPPDSPTCCAGECVSTAGNEDHCGGCGNACAPTESCRGNPPGCCTFFGERCQPAADPCCAGSTCTGTTVNGERVCCLPDDAACTGCEPNSACGLCCSGLCRGNVTDKRCADCLADGDPCTGVGCQPNQACAACCSRQCGRDGVCCNKAPLGANCAVDDDCCSGNCSRPLPFGSQVCIT